MVVDYFSKWVKAEAVRGINTNDVKNFIWKNIITQFGMPQSMIFDSGPQFETPELKDRLKKREIKYHFAAVTHPQANELVEYFNKILSNDIKRKLENAKGLQVENYGWYYGQSEPFIRTL